METSGKRSFPCCVECRNKSGSEFNTAGMTSNELDSDSDLLLGQDGMHLFMLRVCQATWKVWKVIKTKSEDDDNDQERPRSS